MNKPPFNPFWIGFYFGQNCIIHPDTGRWILTGYFDRQVVCRRNIGTDEEDSMIYNVEEISFVFKRIQPSMYAYYCKNLSWIKWKSEDGYWVFDQTFNQIIFES